MDFYDLWERAIGRGPDRPKYPLPREGYYIAQERLKLQREKNASIPDSMTSSRQVRRRKAIQFTKSHTATPAQLGRERMKLINDRRKQMKKEAARESH